MSAFPDRTGGHDARRPLPQPGRRVQRCVAPKVAAHQGHWRNATGGSGFCASCTQHLPLSNRPLDGAGDVLRKSAARAPGSAKPCRAAIVDLPQSARRLVAKVLRAQGCPTLGERQKQRRRERERERKKERERERQSVPCQQEMKHEVYVACALVQFSSTL